MRAAVVRCWPVFCIPLLLLGPWLVGCDGTSPEASPSPEPGNLESYEDQRWEGWLDYSDSTVELHVLTYFDLFESNDGLFCGRFVGYWGYSGAYLAVNTGTEWVTIVDVPEGTYEAWGNEGRLYGTASIDLEITGWLDGTVQSEYDAIDPTVTPTMTLGEEFLYARMANHDQIMVDLFPLTVGELVTYATREGAEPQSGISSTLPADLPLDLPAYSLVYSGLAADGAQEADAHLCTWCTASGGIRQAATAGTP